MALSQDILPANFTKSIAYEIQTGFISNDIQITITAKKNDGTAYDFSSTTGATLKCVGSGTNSFSAQSLSNALTVDSADATSLKVSITASALTSLLGSQGSNAFSARIMASDGTNNVCVANGQLLISATA